MVSCYDYLPFSLLTEAAGTNAMNAYRNSLTLNHICWLFFFFFDKAASKLFCRKQHVYQSWFCCDTRLQRAEIFTICRSVPQLNVNNTNIRQRSFARVYTEDHPYPLPRRFRCITLKRSRTVGVKVLQQTLKWLLLIRSASQTNIPFLLRSHSIQFSTSSYSFKLESDCRFCNEVTSSCDICASLWLAKWSDVILHARILSHHAPVKIPKSKHNFQCLYFNLIAEGIYGISQTKSLSMTSWKFFVQQVWIII